LGGRIAGGEGRLRKAKIALGDILGQSAAGCSEKADFDSPNVVIDKLGIRQKQEKYQCQVEQDLGTIKIYQKLNYDIYLLNNICHNKNVINRKFFL
jgi:hypothetical protein